MEEINPEDVENVEINLEECREGEKSLEQVLEEMNKEELAKTYFVYSSHREESEMYDVDGLLIEKKSLEELESRGLEVRGTDNYYII